MNLVIRGIAFGSGECQSVEDLLSGENRDLKCLSGPTPAPSSLIRRAAASASIKDISTHKIYVSQTLDGMNQLKAIGLDQQLLGEFEPSPDGLFSVLVQIGHQLSENPGIDFLILAGDQSWTTAVILQSKQSQTAGIAEISIFNPDSGKTEAQSPPSPDIGLALLIPGHAPETNQEWIQFSQSFPETIHQKSCALHSLETVVNDPTGLTSLVFAASAVQRSFIPQSRYSSQSPFDFEQKEISNNFTFPERRIPWLSAGKKTPKQTLVAFQDRSHNWVFFRVTETAPRKSLPVLLPDRSGNRPVLIPFTGRTIESISNTLNSLEKILNRGIPPARAASSAYTEFLQSRPGSKHGCIIGANTEQLLKEIKLAQIGIPESFKTGKLWLTPGGSSFSARPLQDSGVALMYPGAFNAFPWMGSELFLQFPILQYLANTVTGNLSRSMAEEWVFPRAGSPDSQQSRDDFYQHPIELIEAGTTLSVIHTLLLKEIFKIQPDQAFGYSLGEISMLWSNQIWKDGETSSREWRDSPLFKNQIFGPMKAIRSYWSDRALEEDFWGSYIIKGELDQIQEAANQFDDAALIIINSPGEAVIAGVDQTCKKIIEQVGSHALPIPVRAAIHHPAMAGTKDLLKSLANRPVIRDSRIDFYSAADYQIIDQSQEYIAESISRMITQPLDFPRLVNQLYQDGARIFIETGPQKTCSRWVSKILDGKPHTAVPMNKKNQDDFLGLLKTLSVLVSHQVDLDLFPLYQAGGNRSSKQNKVPVFPKRPPHPQRRKIYLPGSRIPALHLERILEQEYSRASKRFSKSQETFLQYQKYQVQTQRQLLARTPLENDHSPVLRSSSAPLFSYSDIESFTLGKPEACFDDLYKPFGSQRIPLLPNGPMQFFDRVLSLDGELGVVVPGSSLVSEYSVPDNDWFNPRGQSLPLVALLEIGLQPCGFLSAFSGSITAHPETDYYFRNLDGEGILLSDLNPSGKVIQTRVKLLSSTALQETIIQEYTFELSVEGTSLFKGKSSFGYFPRQMMLHQSGLDGNTPVKPWLRQNPGNGKWKKLPTGKSSIWSQPSLPKIRSSWIDPSGGKHGLGYIFFDLNVPSNAWYFDAHFHQDPVMPGSLGLEAMSQALQLSYPDYTNQEQQWRLAPDHPFQWKYRGQVSRESEQLEVELHITRFDRAQNSQLISADGSLWNSRSRIYEINGLTMIS